MVESYADWLKFLEDANVDKKDAAEYALRFAENDMRLDMLVNLPEYGNELKELGVHKRGHIIKIIRFARNVLRETEGETTPAADDHCLVEELRREVITLVRMNECSIAKIVKTLKNLACLQISGLLELSIEFDKYFVDELYKVA